MVKINERNEREKIHFDLYVIKNRLNLLLWTLNCERFAIWLNKLEARANRGHAAAMTLIFVPKPQVNGHLVDS